MDKGMIVKAFSSVYWQHAKGPHGERIAGQSCVRYFRFNEPVRIQGFEWDVFKRGWSGEGMLKHYPKRMEIQAWEEESRSWTDLCAYDALPRHDYGSITLEQIVHTRCIRAVVKELYTNPSNHTEIAMNPRIVHFRTLDAFRCVTMEKVSVSSESLSQEFRELLADEEIGISNDFMNAGFAVGRPAMTRWAWDSLGTKRQQGNLLMSSGSGPWLRTCQGDYEGGPCKAEKLNEAGREIVYRQVTPIDGLSWNYRFRLVEDALELSVEQIVTKELRAIECEAWRWTWNLEASILSPLAMPIPVGMTGRCAFPMIAHAPNYGNLRIELTEGDPEQVNLRTDTWRERSLATLGVQLGVTLNEDGELTLRPGTYHATIRFTSASIALDSASGAPEATHKAFRRAWGSGFGFRPEHYGMSNNAASLNCHFVQYMYMDLAYHTATDPKEVDISELMGYTIELALADGLGYGDHRDYFMDSDPSLLIAACTYLHKSRNQVWANRNWSAMRTASRRILEKCNEDGLVVCKKLSGISGVRDWSSNWWDVVTFGHLDAYANALAYRALRNLQSVAGWLGKVDEQLLYREAADRLESSYFRTFYNEESGWLAGWKSRDGRLHDYAFLFVNGLAVVNGLVPEEEVQPMLERLERKREAVGFNRFDLGLPGNLIPIPKSDYSPNAYGSPHLEDGTDSFQHYQNGGASMSQSYHYVRALGKAGLPAADRMGEAILNAFENGSVIGGLHDGGDWKTWSGESNGYEGLLTDQCYVLLAVAQNKGLAKEIPLVW